MGRVSLQSDKALQSFKVTNRSCDQSHRNMLTDENEVAILRTISRTEHLVSWSDTLLGPYRACNTWRTVSRILETFTRQVVHLLRDNRRITCSIECRICLSAPEPCVLSVFVLAHHGAQIRVTVHHSVSCKQGLLHLIARLITAGEPISVCTCLAFRSVCDV